MDDSEKIQLIGEHLNELVWRINKLIPLIGHIWKDVIELMGRSWEIDYNRNQLNNRFNELTHIHNEVTAIQKGLGLFGDVPKWKVTKDSSFD